MQSDVENQEKASHCIDREDDKQFLFFFWKYPSIFPYIVIIKVNLKPKLTSYEKS